MYLYKIIFWIGTLEKETSNEFWHQMNFGTKWILVWYSFNKLLDFVWIFIKRKIFWSSSYEELTFFQKVISWRSKEDRIQGFRFLKDFFMILRKYKWITKYFSLLFVFFLRIWWRILGERFWSFEKISYHFDL